MRDGWHSVALRTVASQSRESVAVEAGRHYPAVGVLRDGQGLLDREPFIGGKTTYRKLTPLRAGQLVLRSITAWEAPIAVAEARHEGYHVSGVFPVFDLDRSRIAPDFMRLLCQSELFWQEMRERSTGTVLRRKTLSASALLNIPILLPPLVVQRRIVDLIAAVDDHVAATRSLETAARLALGSLVGDWVVQYSADRVRLGVLARMGSGPSWKATDERTSPSSGGTRVLGITNTPRGRPINMDNAVYVAGLPSTTSLLSPSSLLMIRTNGNRSRIGNVYQMRTEAIGCAFSAFQIGIHFASSADAEFAYWMLTHTQIQHLISENASGTTGLGNIAVGWLKDLELPWPAEPSERSTAVALFEEAQRLVVAADRSAETARSARAALLAEMLSGEHEIPESYDEVLEGAA